MKSVNLDLSAINKSSVSGNAGIGVPAIDRKAKGKKARSSSSTSQVKITLSPPEKVEIASGKTIEELNLAKTIIAVRRELSKGLKDEPILRPKTVDFAIKFAVAESASVEGGVEFCLL